jgi:PAS domain-containing protein
VLVGPQNDHGWSEAHFRGLTALSSDWYRGQDENLRFTYLSNQAQALTGYSGESSLGKTRWEIANMTPLSCTWEEHKAVLAARQPFRDLECLRVGPTGRCATSMSGEPLFDERVASRATTALGATSPSASAPSWRAPRRKPASAA